MSLLHEAAFARLLPKYERVFGEPPPFTNISVDEAVDYMRSRLSERPDRDFVFLEGPADLTGCAGGLQ